MIDPDTLLQHAGFVRALARSLLVDESRVEDVVQQTWLTAIESPPRESRSLRSWLAKVALNFARKAQREEGRRTRREERAARPLDLPGAGDIAEREATIRAVVDAVFSLSEPYRSVIILRFYDDLSAVEIATRLGVSVETVRTRLKRAREQMRRHLDRRHDGNRRAWALALVPLAGLTDRTTASLTVESKHPARRVTGSPWPSTSALVVGSALLVGSFSYVAFSLRNSAHRAPAAPVSLDGARFASVPTTAERFTGEGAPSSTPASSDETFGGAPSSPGDPERALGALRVRMRWEEDGEPAEGVRARVIAAEDTEARAAPAGHSLDRLTGSDGSFEVESLPAGVVGFVFDRMESKVTATIEPGQETVITVQVPRGITLDGVVVDDSGRAVPRAEVVFCRVHAEDSGAVVAVADDTGAFRARSISLNGFYGARARGYSPSALYSLAGEDRAQIQTARLVLPEGGGAVSGRILGASLEPIGDADVVLAGSHESGPREDEHLLDCRLPRARRCRTDDRGRFLVEGVAQGNATLFVRAAGHAPLLKSLSVELGSVTDASVKLSVGATLEGTALSNKGEPVPGVGITVKGEGFDESGFSLEGKTGADGCYRIDHVFAGSIRASARIRTDREFASTTLVARDHESLRWDPAPSREIALRGRIVDDGGNPLVRCAVIAWAPTPDATLWWEKGPGFWRRLAFTDEDGRFTIAPCLDRSHWLEIFEPDQISNTPCVRVEGVSPRSDAIVVRVPSTARPSAFIVGRVLLPNGSPATETLFWARQPHTHYSNNECRPEADGSFRIGPLPPDRYDVFMRTKVYALPLGENVAMAPGQTLDLGTLTLEPPGSLAVTLHRDDGQPMGTPDLVILNSSRDLATRVLQEGNVARAPELAPGRYEFSVGVNNSVDVACTHVPFQIHSGRETALDVTLRLGVMVSLLFTQPEGEEWSYTLRTRVRDAAGSVVWERFGFGRFRDGRIRATLCLTPGTYTVEVLSDCGMTALETLNISEPIPPSRPHEIPLKLPRTFLRR